ncbi:MAG: hypothetical protein QXE80_03515 [Pyrobaculum sp.]
MQVKLTLKDSIILYSLSIYQLLYGKVMTYRALQLLKRIGLDITPEDMEAAFKKSIATGRIRFSDGSVVFARNLSGDFAKLRNDIKFRIQQAIMQEWFEDGTLESDKPIGANVLASLSKNERNWESKYGKSGYIH